MWDPLLWNVCLDLNYVSENMEKLSSPCIILFRKEIERIHLVWWFLVNWSYSSGLGTIYIQVWVGWLVIFVYPYYMYIFCVHYNYGVKLPRFSMSVSLGQCKLALLLFTEFVCFFVSLFLCFFQTSNGRHIYHCSSCSLDLGSCNMLSVHALATVNICSQMWRTSYIFQFILSYWILHK